MTYADRQYQTEANAALARGFAQSNRILGVLPTAAGKTIVFAREVARRAALGQRVLTLAHRDNLVRQAAEKIYGVTGITVEIEKAEERAGLRSSVVVGSVQTLCRETRLHRWPLDHFNLIICDEAHHVLSDSWQTVLSYFKTAQVLGVTATPDRGDKRNLGTFFESIAFEEFMFSRNGKIGLVEQGYLSPISVKSIPLNIDISSATTAYDAESGCRDFEKKALASAIEPYLDEIAAAIKYHAPHRRTLAFNVLIDTSEKFISACKRVGLTAEHVDGQMVDRKSVISRFERGEFQVLSNAMLLTEGWDVNSDPTGIGVDCVVVLRPTQSRPLYCQMVGRGTRLATWKTDLLLLDFLWMHQRHNIVRPAHLIAQSEEEADAITKMTQEDQHEDNPQLPIDVIDQLPLDLGRLAGLATAQREESLRKRLVEAAKRKSKYLSAEEFAAQHNSLAVAEYEPVMRWESEPVSEKQSKYLKQAKIDPETVKGKGHASKLLDIFFAGKRLSMEATPATDAQKKKMRQMGVADWESASAVDARDFFARLRNART